jgi:prepilin-type N-terminal cleavage/methylation domain-containing protein
MGMSNLVLGNRWAGMVRADRRAGLVRRRGFTLADRRAGRVWRRGFTLIELLVVIVIIAIILSFVLLAAGDAARRAEERATQSLISKLEGGLNDRFDALMQSRPDPTWAHGYMATVFSNQLTAPSLFLPNTTVPNSAVQTSARAQVFSWYDYLKREVPDVFFFQNDPNYPINFCAQSFPGTGDPQMSPSASYANFVLPLGNTILNNPGQGQYGDDFATNPNLGVMGSGIYGASYPVAAGLFKNLLGVQPNGYDAVDNAPANNLIDELGEGQWNLTVVEQNHTHATARSEMLYAILVEGTGPLGSVFSRDDFTDREVQDTDGDGLLEFVDAWGQPLQFFRWPILYHSDLQRGQNILSDANTANKWDLVPPYQTYDSTAVPNPNVGSVYTERERDPLDPNQQLTAPQWWAFNGVQGQFAANNNSPFTNLWPVVNTLNPQPSGGVQAFEYFFHRLTEPVQMGNTAPAFFWDRGGSFPRRAFYTKFLILSGGRDRQPGVFLYADADMKQLGGGAASFLIANENNALPFSLDVFGGPWPPSGTNGLHGFVSSATYTQASFGAVSSNDPTHPSSYDLNQAAKDDISNHNLQSVSGIGGSR